MIRVMLVDDQEIIRAGLRTIIDADPSLHVVAEAGEGITALRLLETVAVDVVLMDLRMPGLDGVETTRRIRSRPDLDRTRVLVLTTFDQDENVVAALRAGADGFLGKGAGPEELARAIERSAGGERVLSPNAVNAVIERATVPDPAPVDAEALALVAALTARELEIVELVVAGLDNPAIAARVFVSPFTVKTHVQRAMGKVGARDRAQLVSIAVRAGVRP